jgi:hypothetical protein
MGLFTSNSDKDAQAQRDNDAEERSNLNQLLAEAQSKVERMTIARTPEGMMKMAEEAANQIEETFAVGGMSRAQRFLNITKTIRRQIAIACGGEALWTD